MSDDLRIKGPTENQPHSIQSTPTNKKQIKLAQETNTLAQGVLKEIGEAKAEPHTIEPRHSFTARRH